MIVILCSKIMLVTGSFLLNLKLLEQVPPDHCCYVDYQ